jgi:hypothetical protein
LRNNNTRSKKTTKHGALSARMALSAWITGWQLFDEHVLKAQWGFAMEHGVTIIMDESKYGHKHAEAAAWLVLGNGIGKVWIYPFPDRDTCLNAAATVFQCWVAYRNGEPAQEIGSGGRGFAHQTCRMHGARWLADPANRSKVHI